MFVNYVSELLEISIYFTLLVYEIQNMIDYDMVAAASYNTMQRWYGSVLFSLSSSVKGNLHVKTISAWENTSLIQPVTNSLYQLT